MARRQRGGPLHDHVVQVRSHLDEEQRHFQLAVLGKVHGPVQGSRSGLHRQQDERTQSVDQVSAYKT